MSDRKKTSRSLLGRDSLRTRAFRVGGYSTLLTVIVLGVAVVINLIMGQLPATWTKADLTAGGLFSFSDQTIQQAQGLEEDITITFLAQDGTEDSLIQQFLDRYSGLSSHIRVQTKDPVVYPTLIDPYTDDALVNNSLLVTNADGSRGRYISYYDLYEVTYTSWTTSSASFKGEGALVSAVDYLTDDQLTTIYFLSGHGEQTLGSQLRSSLESSNLALVEDFTLLSAETVPEEAAAVVLYGPQRDLSEDEVRKLSLYLEEGGRLLVCTDLGEEGLDLPNLESLMAQYGLSAQDGLVLEGDSNHYTGYPLWLLPNLGSHAITQPLSQGGYLLLTPLAHPLVQAQELPDGVTVTPLLTTSDQAYLKADGYSMATMDREEGDQEGSFLLAAAAEKTGEEGTVSQVVWVGTSQMFADQFNSAVSGANGDFFLNAVNWLTQREDQISIHPKSLDQETLTVPAADRTRIAWVITGVIPAALIAAGIFICRRRRAH